VAADVPEAAVPPVAAAVAELVAEPAGELLAAPPQPARASPAAANSMQFYNGRRPLLDCPGLRLVTAT
jgi:hypothetical protein